MTTAQSELTNMIKEAMARNYERTAMAQALRGIVITQKMQSVKEKAASTKKK